MTININNSRYKNNTYHSDDIPTGSTSSKPARTYGPIVSPMEKMRTLIDIAENKGVPISVCLYVRGCNRYYIRTNADSVELMDKGGRIDDIDGCFINILELKTTDGVHQLVDENTKELPTYNTELKTNNTKSETQKDNSFTQKCLEIIMVQLLMLELSTLEICI